MLISLLLLASGCANSEAAMICEQALADAYVVDPQNVNLLEVSYEEMQELIVPLMAEMNPSLSGEELQSIAASYLRTKANGQFHRSSADVEMSLSDNEKSLVLCSIQEGRCDCLSSNTYLNAE